MKEAENPGELVTRGMLKEELKNEFAKHTKQFDKKLSVMTNSIITELSKDFHNALDEQTKILRNEFKPRVTSLENKVDNHESRLSKLETSTS